MRTNERTVLLGWVTTKTVCYCVGGCSKLCIDFGYWLEPFLRFQFFDLCFERAKFFGTKLCCHLFHNDTILLLQSFANCIVYSWVIKKLFVTDCSAVTVGGSNRDILNIRNMYWFRSNLFISQWFYARDINLNSLPSFRSSQALFQMVLYDGSSTYLHRH